MDRPSRDEEREERITSPLRADDEVDVVAMAPEEACEQAEERWQGCV